MKLELTVDGFKLQNVCGTGKVAKATLLKIVSSRTTTTTHCCGNVVQQQQRQQQQHIDLGRTEILENTLNPSWVKVFTFDYNPEEEEEYDSNNSKLLIQVLDVHDETEIEIGNAIFNVAECMSCGSICRTQSKRIRSSCGAGAGGTISASIRESIGCGTFHLQMKAQNLRNVEGVFRKSDPFFQLSFPKQFPGGLQWDCVYRSAPIWNNLDPEWEPLEIEVSNLCRGDFDTPIKIEILDYESNGKHKLMGETEQSVHDLLAAAKLEDPIELDYYKEKNAGGTLFIQSAHVSGLEPRFHPGKEAQLLANRTSIHIERILI